MISTPLSIYLFDWTLTGLPWEQWGALGSSRRVKHHWAGKCRCEAWSKSVPCPHWVFKSICYCRVVAQTSPSHLKSLTHSGRNKYFLMESSKNCYQSYWKKMYQLDMSNGGKKPHQKLSAICGLLFLHKMYISYLFTSGVLGFIMKSDACTLISRGWLSAIEAWSRIPGTFSAPYSCNLWPAFFCWFMQGCRYKMPT